MSDAWLVDGPAGGVVLIAATAYTLRASDNNLLLAFTSESAITVTVPSGTLPRGWAAQVMQFGDGIVTLSAQSGMTLYNQFDQFTTAGPYAVLELDAPQQDQMVVSGGVPATDGTSPYAYSQPTTGATITTAQRETRRIIDPASTLATLTVVLPPDPRNGDIYEIMSSQQITLLTVSGPDGETVKAGSFLLNADSGASWLYRASNTTWYSRY
jgi:hypothetical protein